jgi:hypothetical protein
MASWMRYGLLVLMTALTATSAEGPRLSQDQLAKAIHNDSISIPTPGELFAALQKPGKPDWTGRAIEVDAFTSLPCGTTPTERKQSPRIID